VTDNGRVVVSRQFVDWFLEEQEKGPHWT
jgi:hypothetical protein